VASAALKNPANRHRAIPLTYEQFRYAFANAVDEDQARRLYDRFCVPASGEPLFQAAAANLNPWTEAKVDAKNPSRGPMLIIAGGKDHTVPVAISTSSFKHEEDNEGITEMMELDDRGHSMNHRRRLAGGRRNGAEVRRPLRLKGDREFGELSGSSPGPPVGSRR
jgi:pimeloyl-ACP methyl ester carboxylesterase